MLEKKFEENQQFLCFLLTLTNSEHTENHRLVFNDEGMNQYKEEHLLLAAFALSTLPTGLLWKQLPQKVAWPFYSGLIINTASSTRK